MLFLATYILAGRAQAIGVISALLGLSLIIPPVGLLSSAAVALVTLRRGGSEGLVVVGSALLLSVLLGGLFAGNPLIFGVYGAVLWMPVWLVACVLRERVDLALALEAGSVLAAVAVLGIYLIAEAPYELWRGSLELMLRPLVESPPPGFNPEQLRERMDALAHYMTGLVAAGSALGVVASLFLARWWQARLFNPGGFLLEYLALRGLRPMAYAALGLLLATVAAHGVFAEAAGNMLAVCLAFYIVAGISVLHCLCARVAAKRFLLIVLYGAVLVVPHVLLPVMLVGWGDVWLNLRRWRQQAGVG